MLQTCHATTATLLVCVCVCYGYLAPVSVSAIIVLLYQGSRLKHGPMHTACRECLEPDARLNAYRSYRTLHLADTLRSLLSREGTSWKHLITSLILPPLRMSGCLRLLALADPGLRP